MAHVKERCCSDQFWLYLVAIVCLLMFSGLMSGLTLGLMSLGLVDLEVIKESGTPKDRMNAAKIIPVVRKQHLLLVTLLVGNAMAMEALPLFLDSLVDTWMAILLSVTLLLMFGEILPQAVCSRYGLSVGATMAPVVRVLLVVMFPIAWPVSKLLDRILGTKHNDLFRRAELITLVRMHSNEEGKGGELSRHESNLIAGTLQLAGRTVADAMTPIASVVSIDVQSRIDDDIMKSIVASGHSRIPVYSGERNNIIGLILVKNFLNVTVDQHSLQPIINVPIRRIQRVSEDMPLHDVLHQFCQRHSHIAVVVRSKKSFEEKDSTEPTLDSAPTRATNTNTESECRSVDIAEGEADQSGNFEEANALNAEGDRTDSSNSFNPPNVGICGEEPWATWTGDDGDDIIGIITREDVLEELLKVSLNLGKSECKVPIRDGKEPPNTRTAIATLRRGSPTLSYLPSSPLASPVACLTNTASTTSSFCCESPNEPQIILSFPATTEPLSAPSPETWSTWRSDESNRLRALSPLSPRAVVHGQGSPAPTRQVATHRILHSR